MTGQPYEAEVRAYIADCLRHRAQLDPAYHPTADGAVKLIPHGGDAEEAERIRQAFTAVTSLTAVLRQRPGRPRLVVPARPRRVLVTGSRTWTDRSRASPAALREHWSNGAVLVSGACPRGADAIAERLWSSLGRPGRTPPGRLGDRPGRRYGAQRRHGRRRGRCVPGVHPRRQPRGHPHRAAGRPGRHPGPPLRPPRREQEREGPFGAHFEAAALGYIRHGWPVFVLGRSKRPVANCPACRAAGPGHDRAGCGCLTCHGFYAATLDPGRLAAMLRKVPGGLLAIRTGRRVRAVRGRHRPAQRRPARPGPDDARPPPWRPAGAAGTCTTATPAARPCPRCPARPGSTSRATAGTSPRRPRSTRAPGSRTGGWAAGPWLRCPPRSARPSPRPRPPRPRPP